MEGHKPKQKDITMFTVKQNPIHGLKLTLVRDPRSLTAKMPANLSPVKATSPAIPPPRSPAPPRPLDHSYSAKKPDVKADANAHPKQEVSSRRPPSLPVSRVKMVMKTNVKSGQSTVSGVSQESVFVVSKATELFIAQLAKDACKTAEDQSTSEVTYKHLATAVQRNSDQMGFLHDILPEKVRYQDYLASLRPPHTTDSDPD